MKNKGKEKKLIPLQFKLMIAIGLLLMMTIVSLTEIAVVQSEKAVKNSTKSKLLTGIDGINNTIYYKLESVRNELNYVSSKSGSA